MVQARALAVTLLKRLCLPSPHVTFRLLQQLLSLLPEAAAAGKWLKLYLLVSCHSHPRPVVCFLRLPSCMLVSDKSSSLNFADRFLHCSPVMTQCFAPIVFACLGAGFPEL